MSENRSAGERVGYESALLHQLGAAFSEGNAGSHSPALVNRVSVALAAGRRDAGR